MNKPFLTGCLVLTLASCATKAPEPWPPELVAMDEANKASGPVGCLQGDNQTVITSPSRYDCLMRMGLPLPKDESVACLHLRSDGQHTITTAPSIVRCMTDDYGKPMPLDHGSFQQCTKEADGMNTCRTVRYVCIKPPDEGYRCEDVPEEAAPPLPDNANIAT